MEMQQLELNLWSELDRAARFPELAVFDEIYAALDFEMAPMSTAEQLQTAGDVLSQIVDIYASKSDLLIERWEQRHNPTEPIVDLSDCTELFVQSVRIDLSHLIEPDAEVQYPENRQSPRQPSEDDSVAGVIDQETLLSVLEAMAPGANPDTMQTVLALAHDESASTWGEAVLAGMGDRDRVSLLDLTQELGLPLVKIWLGVLLSNQRLQLERCAEADFYDPFGIEVVTLHGTLQ